MGRPTTNRFWLTGHLVPLLFATTLTSVIGDNCTIWKCHKLILTKFQKSKTTLNLCGLSHGTNIKSLVDKNIYVEGTAFLKNACLEKLEVHGMTQNVLERYKVKGTTYTCMCSTSTPESRISRRVVLWWLLFDITEVCGSYMDTSDYDIYEK